VNLIISVVLLFIGVVLVIIGCAAAFCETKYRSRSDKELIRDGFIGCWIITAGMVISRIALGMMGL